ncbi:hypothetical protein EV426DRAFT_641894 [Tirmania nivea]|nr:hypothetical protein EV426DRAFT_641894 [Tirmania nivea]
MMQCSADLSHRIASSDLPHQHRRGIPANLELKRCVTANLRSQSCTDEGCTNNSTIVITALSRANTTDSLEIAAARLANELKKSESLSGRISRCFRTFSTSNKTCNENRTHKTILSVTGGIMTTVAGEGVAVHGEKAKLVKGYRVSLLDWGRGRNKKKSEEQCKGPSSESEKGTENRNGSGTGMSIADPRQKSTTSSTTANNNTTTKSNTDSSSPANDSPTDSSLQAHSTPQDRKGKSSLPRSLLRRSSSSGSNSDVTSTSFSSSSSSFNYGPPEFQDAKNKEEEPIIPDSGVFKSTRLTQVPVTELMKEMIRERGDIVEAFIPTVAQCAAHLELLGCFSKLKAKVEGSEEIGEWLFDKKHDAEGTIDTGNIKWRAFVGKAVERFHMWWINFPEVVKNIPELIDCGKHELSSLNEKPVPRPVKKQVDLKPIEEKNFFRQWKRKPAKSGVMEIFMEFQKNDFGSGVSFRKMTAETLPPLGTFNPSDVLLVWHAYTLNPHAFYEDCIRLNRLELWGMPLPWDLIITGQPADLYQSLVDLSKKTTGNNNIDDLRQSPQKELLCPWCEKSFNVPLAEWHKAGDVGDYDGACGNCGKLYEKEAVSVSMFLKDVYRFFLIEKEREREKGIGGHYIPPGHPTSLDRTFPSPILLSGVLLSAFPQLHPTTNNESLPDIPSLLTAFPNTSSLFSHLSKHTQLADNPDDAISPIPLLTLLLKNIVTTYKYLPPPTTSIPTSTDLGAAVLRQGVFIKKIHDDARHIRSPALAGTIRRARGRYNRFFRLIGKYRGKIFVPTNEIDLVWHTQQCYPALYYLYSNIVTATAGVGGGWKYIDHNDRLGEGILGNGFDETKRLWRVEYRNVRGDMGEGEIPLRWGVWWWVLTGKKPGGKKEGSGQIGMTRAVGGESVVEDEEKNNSESEDEGVENASIAAVTSAIPPTENDIQKDLGKDEGPFSSPAEDIEDWDEDEKYAICCCWNCEMKRDMQEEAGRRKYRNWGTRRGRGKVGFTRKEEWKLRATVHYYRAIEAARNEGRRLPVWKVREPWVGSR